MEQEKSAANSEADSEIIVGLPPNRIEALVDGIFAVAMTILVLELHVPELGEHVTEARLIEAFEGFLPKIFSFVSGFVILGTLWIGHRYQFHYIRASNRAILWINLVFLLTISFLPFVVGLLSTYGALRITCVVYGLSLVLAMGCLLAQWLYAAGPSKRLVAPDLPREVFLGLRNRVLMGMVCYGAGVVLALITPTLSLICYATTPLLYLLPARFDRHVRANR